MAIAAQHVGEFKKCENQARILDLCEKFATGILEGRKEEQKNLTLVPVARGKHKDIRVVIGFKTY